MDPLTIVGSVFALSKVVWNCSTTLYGFVQDVRNVDETVRSLYAEIESLRCSLESVAKTISSPSINKYDKSPLWEDVNDCFLECQKTVRVFSQKLEMVHPKARSKSNFLRASAEQFKLYFGEEEIRTLRAQLHSHTSAMRMILQMITVHISSSAPDIILDELTPQLQALVKLVTELHASALPASISNTGLRRSRTRLEKTAREVASKASVVVSSRSTVWSGSQPESSMIDRAKAIKRILTTGSELGEPLSPEARNRISAWVTDEPRDDSTTTSISEASPSVFSEPQAASAESHTTVEPCDPCAPVHGNGDYSSDEDELEMEAEVARTYLVEGRKTAQTDPSEAEKLIRQALSKYKSMSSRSGSGDIAQITLELAVLCFHLDKLPESIELCVQLLRESPTDDEGRERVLRTSHLLAQVQLRDGQLDAALRQCRQTLKGRRRFEGKNATYYESVMLMATIYDQKDDTIEALACRGMLDADLPVMTFKLPVSKPAGTIIRTADDSIVPLQSRTMPEFRAVEPRELGEDDALTLVGSLEDLECCQYISKEGAPALPARVAARLARAKQLSISFSAAQRAYDQSQSTPSDTHSGLQEGSNNLAKDRTDCTLAPFTTVDRGTAVKIRDSMVLPATSKSQFQKAQLFHAVTHGYDLVVRLLLADWGAYAGHKASRSMWAPAKSGRTKPIYLTDDKMRTLLHIAAEEGHHVVVRILLAQGASPIARMVGSNATGQSAYNVGPTPVALAVRKGHHASVEEFLGSGNYHRTVDASGWSLLHHAACSGNKEIFTALLERGFDAQAQTNDGKTVLEFATIQSAQNIVDVIRLRNLVPDATNAQVSLLT